MLAAAIIVFTLPAVAYAQRDTGGSGGRNADRHLDAPYVVLISIDGASWDHPDRVETPGLDRLERTGVRAEGLVPVFPTVTFPNHYSIVTGMYAESHGLIDNTFYDPVFDATYSFRDRSTVEDGRWYGGEPIWVTAERQGMVSATFFWVGSEAPVNGVSPSHFHLFDASVPGHERVSAALDWLELPAEERPHLITLYFGNVDAAAHVHGPESDEIDAALAEIDGWLVTLLDGIERLPIADQVHVIVVSDHGMAWADETRAIYLDDVVDLAGVRRIGSGSHTQLWFDGDGARLSRVYDQLRTGLRNARAYVREEIPERFRYRGSRRAPDILVVADEGFLLRPDRVFVYTNVGHHGYDPAHRSMQGIFYAAGPRIRPSLRVPAFELVHIYPLLAQILGLEPNPEADGRLSVLQPILR